LAAVEELRYDEIARFLSVLLQERTIRGSPARSVAIRE